MFQTIFQLETDKAIATGVTHTHTFTTVELGPYVNGGWAKCILYFNTHDWTATPTLSVAVRNLAHGDQVTLLSKVPSISTGKTFAYGFGMGGVFDANEGEYTTGFDAAPLHPGAVAEFTVGGSGAALELDASLVWFR